MNTSELYTQKLKYSIM